MERFVGRANELGTLRAVLDDLMTGTGAFVLVRGEAGIGKTSLLSQLVDLAAEQGIQVLTGGCYDLTVTPPFGLWLDLIRNHQDDDGLPPVSELVNDSDGLASIKSQDALFDSVISSFVTAARTRPYLLVLEDLHWADRTSLDLLRALARTVHAEPVALIASYRDDEITRRHHLYQLLPVLVREAGAMRIDLRPLRNDDVLEFVSQKYDLNDFDQHRLGHYLNQNGEGHPLFTTELLHSLEYHEILRRREPGWELGDLDRMVIPELVQQMIDGRLASLSERSQRALREAALIGEIVPVRLWEQVSGHEIVESALDDGLAIRLLIEGTGGGEVKFRHALLREAIHESMTLTERHRLHTRIGDYLIDLPGSDPDVVAYHLSQTGDPRAWIWLIAAGERAERTFALVEALERYKSALHLMQQDPASPQVSGLLLKIGRLMRSFDARQGIAYVQEAQQAAVLEDSQTIAAYAQFTRGLLTCIDGDPRSGIGQMFDAMEALGQVDNDEEFARWAMTLTSGNRTASPLKAMSGTLILWLAAVGRYQEAVSVAERNLELDLDSERLLDQMRGDVHQTGTSADGLVGLGIALAGIGNPDGASTVLNAAIDHLLSVNHHSAVLVAVFPYLNFLHLQYHAEDLEERQRLLGLMDASRRRVLERPDYRDDWMWEYVMLREGRWEDLERVVDVLPMRLVDAVYRDIVAAGRAQLALFQGKHDQASELMRGRFRNGPDTVPGTNVHISATECMRVAAEIAVDTGDLAAAEDWLRAHDRWLDWNGAVLGRAEGMYLLAVLRLAEGNADLANELAYHALQLASKPSQPLVLVKIYRLLGELATFEARFIDAEEHLTRSLTIASRCATPFERSLTLIAFAELEAAREDVPAALSHLDSAETICEMLGADPSLKRIRRQRAKLDHASSTGSHGLTPRQYEVMLLLAKGMTDREIAGELFISRFTVMRHVAHILQRFDVTSRAGAVAHAMRAGIITSEDDSTPYN